MSIGFCHTDRKSFPASSVPAAFFCKQKNKHLTPAIFGGMAHLWRATQEADKQTPSAHHFPLYRRKPIYYLGAYPQHFMAHNLRSKFDRQKQRKSTFDTPVSKQHLLQGRTYTPCTLQGVTHYTLTAKFVCPAYTATA